jgi:hypothetical protein
MWASSFTDKVNNQFFLSNLTNGFLVSNTDSVNCFHKSDNSIYNLIEVLAWPTAIKHVNKPRSKKFAIRPNPNNGTFYIKLGASVGQNCRYTIINTNGWLVQEGTLIKQEQEINVSGLAAGQYVVNVYDEGWWYSEKMIKE